MSCRVPDIVAFDMLLKIQKTTEIFSKLIFRQSSCRMILQFVSFPLKMIRRKIHKCVTKYFTQNINDLFFIHNFINIRNSRLDALIKLSNVK